MELASFFVRTSYNNLRRGGQRALVALLCVAFGVMSLVAMTLVSHSMSATLLVDPRLQFGADLSLVPQGGAFVGPEQVAELQRLQEAGAIERYALVAQANGLFFRVPGSNESLSPATGLGIDPAVYPLAGALTLGSPGGAEPAALLQSVGDVLVTRDLAAEHGLRVGGPIVLTDLEVGAPVQGYIRGIVNDTPNHMGGKLYYSLATAQALAGGRNAANVALVTSADPEATAAELRSSGWTVYTATEAVKSNHTAYELIDLLLKGAGMLGLLVAGIGIANTMQVLLRRRRREVAIWKTLGYRERDLQWLFATEAALLGTLGSLLGAGLALPVSAVLADLFRNTGNLLFVWDPAPALVAAGVAVGIVTAVIFALHAIMAAARVPPQALLRGEAVADGQLSRARALALAAALALPFAAVTSLVMGSVLKGVGLLLFALAGLVCLGGLLAALAWIATHLLPRRVPLVAMARNSLERRGLAPVFAMIALFAGAVAIALGVVFTQNAGREMGERTVSLAYDVVVTAPADQESAVRQAVTAQGVEKVTCGYQTFVQAIRLAAAQGDSTIAPVLIARNDPYDFVLQGAPWGSDPEGVYTFRPSGIPIGSSVEVVLASGQSRTLPVVGTYDIDWGVGSLPQETGLLLPAGLSLSLAPPDTLQYGLDVPPGAAAGVSADLGAALPQATVISLYAYLARFTQAYHNLFVLAVAMAGLAFLAGVLLVANSVSLAMLDRRYEIGVLKAVGYSRRHILTALAVEYALVALIPTVASLAVVEGLLGILAAVNDLAADLIAMPVPVVLLIGLAGVGLTLLAALGAAWRPTEVSPVVVLNDQC